MIFVMIIGKPPGTKSHKKHCESKKETYMVEGYYSRIRNYLARFKRKAKGYSKKQFMLENSLKLLFLSLIIN